MNISWVNDPNGTYTALEESVWSEVHILALSPTTSISSIGSYIMAKREKFLADSNNPSFDNIMEIVAPNYPTSCITL